MEKEKKGKKITAVLIAAVLIVIMMLCMMGCQSGDGGRDPTGNTANTTGTTTAATAEGTGTSEPSTGATEPSETPTETATGATEPSTEATQPSTEGSKPTNPKETEPKATEPKETNPKETTPKSTEHSHSYSSKVVAPTCTADGYTTYTCSCGDSYTADKVSKTGHKFGAWYTTKEPTTTSTGTAERKCSACGTTETKTIDKLPEAHKHGYSGKVTTEPTCTKDGVKTFSCSCGDGYTEYIPATGHKYSVTSEKAGTCKEDGSKVYTCSNCKDSYSESTGKADHNWVHRHTDEVGHEESYVVCWCGNWSCKRYDGWEDAYEEHLRSVEKPSEHSYYKDYVWVVDTPATDYDECSVCGATK